jgi:hypothetical protein
MHSDQIQNLMESHLVSGLRNGQWILSIPRKYNPAADSTGKNCVQNQNGEVWFLAGTFGDLQNENVIYQLEKHYSFQW